MIMSSSKHLHCFLFYLSTMLGISQYLASGLYQINRIPSLFNIIDALFTFYFRLCGLKSISIDIDEQTTVRFWTPIYRRFYKPNLVIIHGSGGDTRWQFLQQDRSYVFQAKQMVQGLKRLNLDRFSVYSVSYGAYVAYWMAEMCPRQMEKLVIVSSGIGWNNMEEREKQIRLVGRSPKELFMPATPHDLRLLGNVTLCRGNLLNWVPEFLLQRYLNEISNVNRKEKLELIDHVLANREDNFPIITQETLIIWGDQDKIFPPFLAYRLQRHLGSKARVEIIKDTGHAVYIEAPGDLNRLITTFILGHC
ncbi:uncharacterized protein LOC110634249 isoform X2 [Hevea brasiliensis]|uniref:uncharacterized protein LOC110634249 isoform X2 n=1 Tax=Hevea brasiliensis TaxID=3981 RepID=UPI0025E200FF|nr:uncharacterized protein LOC110634249 isoform X2 [Hevea brasiliensis]